MTDTRRAALLRRILCLFQMCRFVLFEDANGVGGHCVHCGKVSGYMTHAELRDEIDRRATSLAAKQKSESRKHIVAEKGDNG